MFTTDNTTTSKTVKIFAPFRLNAAQRRILADGQCLNIAAPLKAWLAQVELENIKERMTMGVKARPQSR